jgi:hypothetical protein
MTYLAELDDRPLEVRRGYAANVLSFWPKVPGEGNVQLDEAPTFRLYSPSGAAIGGELAADVTDVSSDPDDPDADDWTRADLAIDASDQTVWDLLEHFRADVSWTYGERDYLTSLDFSCVREPYVPALSLNDFCEEVADAREFLLGQAQALHATRKPEHHASVLAVKAWGDVYRKLQARLRDQGRIFPRLILDRWKIDQVVIAQALVRLFRAEAGSEKARALVADWKAEADQRFAQLGDLPYDANDDGIKDEELHSPIEVKLRRSW